MAGIRERLIERNGIRLCLTSGKRTFIVMSILTILKARRHSMGNDGNILALFLTVVLSGLILAVFWRREPRTGNRIGDLPRSRTDRDLKEAVRLTSPLEALTREAHILAETALTEVEVRTHGSNLYVNGSFMYNGYVRRTISVTLENGALHYPLCGGGGQRSYIFDRRRIIEAVNAAIKAAPQWDY